MERWGAVADPQALLGSYHHTVGSWAVRGAGAAPTWQRPRHAFNAAHPHVFLSVNDVHAKVRSIRKIVSLCHWICPGNVRTGDGVAGHLDHTEETDGSIPVVILVFILTIICRHRRHRDSNHSASEAGRR